MSIRLKCPVCGKELADKGSSLVCEKNHSFDRARQGYVNLLPVQHKHSLIPGDNAEMLRARRAFLDSGRYEPICNSVIDCISQYAGREPRIADIGCGEGYYTSRLKAMCPGEYIGIDISKDGARMSCSRDKDILWLVATASRLPVCDGQLDGVCAIFSLLMPEEYARVLKEGGCVVEVTAGTDHLIELKSIIYDEVFEQNKHPSDCGELFEEAICREYRFGMTLDGGSLGELLMMTPHIRRIHREKREKLGSIGSLGLTVHYWVRVLIKR